MIHQERINDRINQHRPPSMIRTTSIRDYRKRRSTSTFHKTRRSISKFDHLTFISLALIVLLGIGSSSTTTAFIITPSSNIIPKSSHDSITKLSSSSSTIIEANVLLTSSQQQPLKSFVPSLFEKTSITNGKIITIQNNAPYGGRSKSSSLQRYHPIIVNSPSGGVVGSSNNVLGFDLKMVSPSIEESQMENSSSRNNRRKDQLAPNKNEKSISTSSNKQKSNNHHHDYRGSIGIDTLNTQNASPIKKQIVNNLLLQSYNEFGQVQRRRNRNMNPFQFTSVSSSSGDDDKTASTTLLDQQNVRGGGSSSSDGKSKLIRSDQESSTNVPMWFPYIPTRQQIESLKIVELKDACYERGLIKVRLHI